MTIFYAFTARTILAHFAFYASIFTTNFWGEQWCTSCHPGIVISVGFLILCTPILICTWVFRAVVVIFLWLGDRIYRGILGGRGGRPPVVDPGNRMVDLVDGVVWHPVQKRRHRKHLKKTQQHEHGILFPTELIELVLSHLSSSEDLYTLSACSLLCPCWLAPARARTFHHIVAEKEKAYTLHRLLRSPFCTFHASVRRVSVYDSGDWNVADALLTQMAGYQKLAPTTVYLRLEHPIRAPNPLSALALSVVHLTLTVASRSAFEGRLSKLASFLSAFQSLEELHIHSIMYLEPLVLPSSQIPPSLSLPKLRYMECTGGHHTMVVEPVILKLILHWVHTPLLERLVILPAPYLITGQFSEDRGLLARYLRSEAGQKLTSLEIGVIVEATNVESAFVDTIIPLEIEYHTFPALKSLTISPFDRLMDGSGNYDKFTGWMLDLVRRSRALTSLSLGNFGVNEATNGVLTRELMFERVEGCQNYIRPGGLLDQVV